MTRRKRPETRRKRPERNVTTDPNETPPFYPEPSPKFKAAVDMVRRTGARDFQLRYQDDDEPVVWMAVAHHVLDPENRPLPAPLGGFDQWTVGAGFQPEVAATRLCEELIDGGICTHCGKPSVFEPGFGRAWLEEHVCWTQYDPELAVYRRGCEGETPPQTSTPEQSL